MARTAAQQERHDINRARYERRMARIAASSAPRPPRVRPARALAMDPVFQREARNVLALAWSKGHWNWRTALAEALERMLPQPVEAPATAC